MQRSSSLGSKIAAKVGGRRGALTRPPAEPVGACLTPNITLQTQPLFTKFFHITGDLFVTIRIAKDVCSVHMEL